MSRGCLQTHCETAGGVPIPDSRGRDCIHEQHSAEFANESIESIHLRELIWDLVRRVFHEIVPWMGGSMRRAQKAEARLAFEGPNSRTEGITQQQ